MSTERIHQDPAIMVGKPVIKGTRITVELILRHFAAGMSEADIIDLHPQLASADIRAAIEYAAKQLPKSRIEAAE